MNAVEPKTLEPNIRPDCTDELTAALRQRILVLDGAMGTAIQRDRPDEAGYRGERFADWPTDSAGQQRPAHPDRSREIIAGIHREYLEAGADILETNTFNANAISLSDYGMEELAYELNFAGAALAREAARRVQHPGASPATSPARSARRPGPRRSRRTSTTPAPATSPTTSWSRPTSSGQRPGRRRRRPPPHRDDLRHAERQGGDLRRSRRCSRSAAAAGR